jgi:hypothetical protein
MPSSIIKKNFKLGEGYNNLEQICNLCSNNQLLCSFTSLLHNTIAGLWKEIKVTETRSFYKNKEVGSIR